MRWYVSRRPTATDPGNDRRYMIISRRSRIAVISVFALLVVLPLLVGAVIAISSGKGVIGYQNVYGLFISWTSLVVSAGVFVAAFVVALIARAIYHWRVRRGI